MALASVATASAETLALSSSAKNSSNGDNTNYAVDSRTGTAALSNGNICLTWSGEEADTMLTSWKLSFTLTDSTIIADIINQETETVTKQYSYLFGSLTSGGGASGYTLRVNSDGALEFSNITTAAGTIQAGVATDITLSFIADEKLNTQTNNSVLTGGTFTLTVGKDGIWRETVSFQNVKNETYDSLTNYCTSILNGVKVRSYTENGTTKTQNYSTNLWTNGGQETFSNIKLEKLSNKVLPVPEPTTATLSLLALAGLAARRRRR